MVIERRDTVRLDVAWKAVVTRLNGEQLPGSTDNVSMTGVNIILNKELVLAEPVKLDLVAKSGSGLCYFTLDCVVVYIRDMDENMGTSIGLRLLAENSEFQPYLMQLVNSYTSRLVG